MRRGRTALLASLLLHYRSPQIAHPCPSFFRVRILGKWNRELFHCCLVSLRRPRPLVRNTFRGAYGFTSARRRTVGRSYGRWSRPPRVLLALFGILLTCPRGFSVSLTTPAESGPL